MTQSCVWLSVAVALSSGACGGSVAPRVDDRQNLADGGGGSGGAAAEWSWTPPPPAGGSGGTASVSMVGGGAGGSPLYVEPECPDVAATPGPEECALFGDTGGCGLGLSCSPYVEYPSTPCGAEIFGTHCVTAGVGRQGDECDDGCAEGHICVSSARGLLCVQMCPIDAPDDCPPGLLCGSLDVEGLGGCI